RPGLEATANHADVILRSSRVLTMAGAASSPSGVALAGGTILGAGGERFLRGVTGPDTELLDFGDRPILPGFVDAHAHIEMYSLAIGRTVDCHTPPCESIDDVLGILRENLDLADRTGGWLIGQGSLLQDLKLREG